MIAKAVEDGSNYKIYKQFGIKGEIIFTDR